MLRLLEAEPDPMFNAMGALTRADPQRGVAFYNLGMTLLAMTLNAVAIDAVKRAVDGLTAPNASRTLVLNSLHFAVGELYLWGAWGRLGPPQWYSVRCGGIVGERGEADLVQETVADFCNKYLTNDTMCSGGTPSEQRLDRVRQKMRAFRGNNRASFILLQGVHKVEGRCILEKAFPEALILAHVEPAPPPTRDNFPEPNFCLLEPMLELEGENLLIEYRDNLDGIIKQASSGSSA